MSPFYKPLPKVPGFGVDVTAESIGWGVVGGVAALTAAHAVGSVIRSHGTKRNGSQEGGRDGKPTSPREG
jgi:hydrogenase small subunit